MRIVRVMISGLILTLLCDQRLVAEPIPSAFIDSALPRMISIAGGRFMMGTNIVYHKAEVDASPAHPIVLSPFLMAETLVMQGLWEQFLVDIGYIGYTYKHAYYGRLEKNSQGNESPAIFLTWSEAIVFCNWLSHKVGLEPAYVISGTLDPLKRGGIDVQWVRGTNGYRLITEAEWEYVVYEKGASRDSLYALYDAAFAIKQQRKVPSVLTGQKTSSGVLAYPNFGVREWTWDEYMVYGLDEIVDPTGKSGLSSDGNNKVNRFFINHILYNRLASSKESGEGEFITIRLAQDRQ